MKFSQRNGCGPVPTMPPPTDNDSNALVRAREMQPLFNSLTAAEEAAIRQITPLISIIRLKHGNLGTKGNTSCVWQQSKLNRVLPNLPRECKFIVVTRQSGRGPSATLSSTRFNRESIHRALVLLKETGLQAWDIDIDAHRLAQ